MLRVDAPLFYGRQVLVPAAAALAQRYVGLGLDLRLSDRFADVIGEGLDAVLRVGQIADSGLVALPIGEQQLRVYGAPRYFKRRRAPQVPADVEGHDCVVFRNPSSGRERPWDDGGARPLQGQRRHAPLGDRSTAGQTLSGT